MKTNLVAFIRAFTNRREKDVFKHTQGRLIRVYSGMIMLFLILFIVIVYSVLYFVILNNQERELKTMIEQEASFIENYLSSSQQSDLHSMQDQEVVFAGANQFFYYVVHSDGELILGNEANSRMRPQLLGILNKSFKGTAGIYKEIVHIQGNPRGRGGMGEFRPPEQDQDIRLMIASQPLYSKGEYIGQLYIGKDISFAYQLFHWMLVILFVIGLVFFGVAMYISAVMSKRAMVPISRAYKRQQEFVADASHELRTPLSVLLSSVDAMEMTIEPSKDGFSNKMLTNMRQEIKRMSHLVTDLLTLARSDSNRLELAMESFEFFQQAQKAMESVRPLAALKGIALHLIGQGPVMVTGDQQKLSQLLYILLDNGIKYTPNGGEVKLHLTQKGKELGIIVQDTGIGIRKEDYSRIFERFYRADASRTRQMGGHGLGLSIAKWIVEAHKGTIKVSSEIDKGTSFIIRIPQPVGPLNTVHQEPPGS
ncbi:sensor histidine kinase [Neobacillus muris]|uniref:sensor histidine kinase n=1 Tax=Neobacillus muris TaxID=2941334 RepID=UPI00204046A0|nr:ATP-binding protein [Neobacillus muris]